MRRLLKRIEKKIKVSKLKLLLMLAIAIISIIPAMFLGIIFGLFMVGYAFFESIQYPGNYSGHVWTASGEKEHRDHGIMEVCESIHNCGKTRLRPT